MMSDAWYLGWISHHGGKARAYLLVATCWPATPEPLAVVWMNAAIEELLSAKHMLESWTKEQESAA